MKHEFVEYIPKELQPDTVYVSMENETVVHSCFCGCGGRVVTPLSPAAWELTFDGDSISLYPSIGNWNLECKSHYWIRGGRVHWDKRWSDERIEAGRRWEARKREEYYRGRTDQATSVEAPEVNGDEPVGLWSKLKSWLSR
jgi:hypothetical protein